MSMSFCLRGAASSDELDVALPEQTMLKKVNKARFI